jgi:Sigma-70 region 2
MRAPARVSPDWPRPAQSAAGEMPVPATDPARSVPVSSVADFDEFYAATGPSLTGQVYLLTGNREEARDCVQEAMERAWLR